MSASYLLTIPRPPRPELDGAVQEASWLREHFGGSIHYLYPARRFRRWLPPALWGIHKRTELRMLDRRVDLHHMICSGFHGYPALPRLAKPVVYTLVTAVERPPRSLRGAFWEQVRVLAVPDAASAERLAATTELPIEVIPPGIDLERFRRVEPPATEPFVVLAASAPWSARQFETKGYDMLLDAAERLPDLELVLLWRGVLREEAEQRIASRGLGGRVRIVHETVDVNRALAGAHATIALAADHRQLKAYPHSLLESLAAGRPVITSPVLAIADLVRREGVGVVLERHDTDALISALEKLRAGYAEIAARAGRIELVSFSRRAYLEAYGRLYSRFGGGGERA